MQNLLEQLLIQAQSKKATDIHLTWKKDKLTIFFRIKGRLKQERILEVSKGQRLSNYIKFKSKIDLNYRQHPKTGQFEWQLQDEIIQCRVSSIPTHKGDNLVIRILNKEPIYYLEDLTYQTEAIMYLNHLNQCHQGLICICGPTGEGKSTTLHTLLKTIYDRRTVNIITIEDPIEINEPNFIQIQINFDKGLDFENALKQILRHDPDIIMIGEIRDEQSAAFALRCALTGCLVLTTIHANNCIGAICRLLNLKLTPLDLTETVQGILSQRIIYPRHDKNYAIYEWMTKEDIINWFDDPNIHYHDFYQQIQTSLQRKEIMIEDFQNSEFSPLLFDDRNHG